MVYKHFFLQVMLTVLVAFVSLSASAYDFEDNGFYYNVVSLSDLTCEVTSGDTQYTGDVKIPSTATYKGRTFSVVRIGEYAFKNATLTSVEIPNSITSIVQYAFYNCDKLKLVVFGNGVTSFGNDLFFGCGIIPQVQIGTKEGMNYVLGNMRTITTLIISEDYADSSIPTLYNYYKTYYYYISNLDSLTTIICKKTVPPTLLGTYFTNSQYLDLEVYVPAESLETYKAADVWKDFWELKAIDYATGISTIKVEKIKSTDAIYDLQGRKLKTQQKGLNIINGKKLLVK